MQTLSIRCKDAYKNDVLDHMAKMGQRYRSQSHFLHEAIDSKMKSDLKDKEQVAPL